MAMTGLFISIDDYIPEPIDEGVEQALRIMNSVVIEEYDYYSSSMNKRAAY